MKNIAIIGAGVIGLTTGIRLLEQGYNVTILARDITDNMASRAAVALWLPYKAAPHDLVLKWAAHSWNVFQILPEEAGVKFIDHYEYHHNQIDPPVWASLHNHCLALNNNELPAPYVCGFATKLFLIDTAIYVDYLLERFKHLQGQIFQREVKKLEEVDSKFNLIIHSSGVWSRYLADDARSFPIRGQFVLTEKPKGLDRIIFGSVDDNCYTLIAPRTHDCYIGGTTLNNDWNTAVDENTTNLLIERAKAFVPELENVKILKTGVGLRPGRDEIRLEAGLLTDGRKVIHHYGHGGSGFTVSWGAAEDVVAMVNAS